MNALEWMLNLWILSHLSFICSTPTLIPLPSSDPSGSRFRWNLFFLLGRTSFKPMNEKTADSPLKWSELRSVTHIRVRWISQKPRPQKELSVLSTQRAVIPSPYLMAGWNVWMDWGGRGATMSLALPTPGRMSE